MAEHGERPGEFDPNRPPVPPPAPPTVIGVHRAAIVVPRPPEAFGVGAAFRIGWRAFGGCYSMLLVSALVVLGINVGSSLVGMVVPLGDMILWLLIVIPLTPGATYIGITACREGSVTIDDLFLGFRCYGRSLLLGVLIALIVTACALPGLAALGGVWLSSSIAGGPVTALLVALVVGGLISAVAGLYFTVRLNLAYGLIVDPAVGDVSATEALAISWRLTSDRVWQLVGITVLLGLIGLGSTLLLCVGYAVLGVPLGMAVNGAVYWLLTQDHGRTICLRCGYDLTGTVGGRCPECGEISAEAAAGYS